MPFNGLLPFIQNLLKEWTIFLKSQCPLSGFFHFYYYKYNPMTQRVMSQCPLSGFFHFYTKYHGWKHQKSDWVNALYRASSISTRMQNKRRKTIIWVNALYRASSISTLPSGNALKWSICGLDFASNCLTISKSAYFLLFLCLFTLCSYFVTVQHKKIIDNTTSLFIVLLIIFLW